MPDTPSDLPTISRDQIEAKLHRGDDFELVEALPADDYRKFHLPTAKNLPPRETRRKARDVLPDEHAEIVVYGADDRCISSRRTAVLLREMGYRRVLHYPGGKMDWRAAGLPVEVGLPPQSRTDGPSGSDGRSSPGPGDTLIGRRHGPGPDEE